MILDSYDVFYDKNFVLKEHCNKFKFNNNKIDK